MERTLFYLILQFIILIFLNKLTEVEATIPGSFFWKPRLGVYLTKKNKTIIPTLKTKEEQQKEIEGGRIVIIREYEMSLTVLAIAAGIQAYEKGFIYLQPDKPYFYTNAYRWGLRHFDAVWYVLGTFSPYANAHKVWRNRFTRMDSQMPKVLRWMVPFITQEEWDKEQYIHKMYKKEAEHTFAKHYRYPTKVFDDWKSEKTIPSAYISTAESDDK